MEGGRRKNFDRETIIVLQLKRPADFWNLNAPPVKKIIETVKKVLRLKKTKKRVDPTWIVNQKTQARQSEAATKHLNDMVSLLCKDICGKVEKEKHEDVFQLIFENVNCLGVIEINR